MAAEALVLHVEGMTEDGDVIPNPRRSTPSWPTGIVKGSERLSYDAAAGVTKKLGGAAGNDQ